MRPRLHSLIGGDQRIRIMKFVAEGVIERYARDFLAGDGIEHDQIVRKHRERADRLGQAKPFEHAEHVGPELDAGADLLEGSGLLDDLRGNSLTRQRQCGGEPPDAAADDQNLLGFPGVHRDLLRAYLTFTSPRRGEGALANSRFPDAVQRAVARLRA